MSTDDILRLHYQERQFLGARDFDDEQTYLIEARRRNNVSGRTWGILSGLDIRSIDNGPWLVTAGAMLDAYGRETYVFEDTPLDVTEIASKISGQGATIKVWLAYATEATSPAASGYLTCADKSMNTRTRESFRLIYQDDPVPFDSQLPDDSSLWPVATQDLPDDPLDAPWPVLLGTITWDGTAIASADGTGRRYSGLRGTEVVSQTAQFDVHPGQLRLFVDTADGALLTTVTGSLSPAPTDVNLHLRTNGSNGGGKIVVAKDDVDLQQKLSVTKAAIFKETVGNGAGKLLLEVDTSNVATLSRMNGTGSAHDIAITTNNGAGGNSVRIAHDSLVMKDVTAEERAVFKKGLDSWDQIILKTSTGADDTDAMIISRAQPTNTTNVNDLRVQIGDDLDGTDRFVVGPVYWADGLFKEQFIVDNKGNVKVAADATIAGKLTTTGTVNNRNIAVDGAKLDQIVIKDVGVTEGVIFNGQLIPPPAGFTAYHIIVSPAQAGPATITATSFSFSCQVLSNGTVQMEWHFGSSTIPGWAHYLAIGIK